MKILLSGGGIAGLAAAIQFHRSGNELTIIDSAKSFQNLGYGLSLEGFVLELMDQLGLLGELKARELPIEAFEIIQLTDNQPIRTLPKATFDAMVGGMVPIARADLHGILYEAARQSLDVRFDTRIADISQANNSTAATVTFSDNSTDTFDMVVVAEGLRSSTRQLLWGDAGWKPFDIAYAAATIDQLHSFKVGRAYMYRGVGKSIAFFPITDRKIVIQAYMRGVDANIAQRSHTKAALLETFKDAAPHITQLLEAIGPDDYIFYDSIAMIDLPKLFQGRVVILGDAGYCPTFLSGMGASLGLLGAKILHDAIASKGSIDDALQRYDEVMQSIAQHFQSNAISNMERELPPSAEQAESVNAMMRSVPLSLLEQSSRKELTIEQHLLDTSTKL